jgi:serine/threonine protein kinase
MIHNKYKIQSIVGQGKFGTVYEGIHIHSREPVAIKIEKVSDSYKLLKHEITILNYLNLQGKCRNVPKIYYFGKYLNHTLVMVMPLYDHSLHQHVHTGSTTTTTNHNPASIMHQCICILESIHTHFVLHRDIKPHNFMMKSGEIFLIDFGLSTIYIDDNRNHKINTHQEHITGTPKYISYFHHNGESLSRRDDMISLGYIFLFLQNRELDWNYGLNILENGDKMDKSHIMHPSNQLLKMAKTWTPEALGSRINKESNIYEYMNHVYNLSFDERPDYFTMKRLFS